MNQAAQSDAPPAIEPPPEPPRETQANLTLHAVFPFDACGCLEKRAAFTTRSKRGTSTGKARASRSRI